MTEPREWQTIEFWPNEEPDPITNEVPYERVVAELAHLATQGALGAMSYEICDESKRAVITSVGLRQIAEVQFGLVSDHGARDYILHRALVARLGGTTLTEEIAIILGANDELSVVA